MNRALPTRAWAVVYRGRLAIVNAQAPIFWLRKVAQQFNVERLEGAGRIVAVTITEPPATSRARTER